MEAQEITGLVLAIGGLLSSVLVPVILALINSRKSNQETQETKEQSMFIRAQAIINELQEEREKYREYNKELLETNRQYESERIIIINSAKDLSIRVGQQDVEISLLKHDLEQKEKFLQEAYIQIAQIEETNRIIQQRLNDKIKEVDRKAIGASSMAIEAKRNTADLEEKLRNTGALRPQPRDNKKGEDQA